MKKTIIIYFLIYGAVMLSVAQPLSLPYYTGFENAEEQSGWQQYKMMTDDPTYQWKYTTAWAPPYTWSTIALYHSGNNVAGVPELIDWMVSPPLEFLSESDISFRFIGGGFGIPSDGCKLYFSGGSPDPAVGDYVEIANLSQSTNYEWKDTLFHITHSAPTGYIAFRFHIAGKQWFSIQIDSIIIAPSNVVGINEPVMAVSDGFVLYPNPSNGSTKLIIQDKNLLNGGLSLSVCDIFGREVYFISNICEQEIMVEMPQLSSGTYLFKLINRSKIVAVKKLYFGHFR